MLTIQNTLLTSGTQEITSMILADKHLAIDKRQRMAIRYVLYDAKKEDELGLYSKVTLPFHNNFESNSTCYMYVALFE